MTHLLASWSVADALRLRSRELALIGLAFGRAIRSGHSPVGVFSKRADGVFVDAVRLRWQRIRHAGSGR